MTTHTLHETRIRLLAQDMAEKFNEISRYVTADADGMTPLATLSISETAAAVSAAIHEYAGADARQYLISNGLIPDDGTTI